MPTHISSSLSSVQKEISTDSLNVRFITSIGIPNLKADAFPELKLRLETATGRKYYKSVALAIRK